MLKETVLVPPAGACATTALGTSTAVATLSPALSTSAMVTRPPMLPAIEADLSERSPAGSRSRTTTRRQSPVPTNPRPCNTNET
eukprot:COSAG06_NODE_44965_length_358_cov_7.571429_1_plen_83_part_10